MDKCTRQLAVRWSLLLITVVNTFWVAVWLVRGQLPVADTLLMARGPDTPTIQLPYALPRFIDPVAAMVPLTLLVWFGFWAARTTIRRLAGSTHTSSVEDAFFYGLGFGVCGSLFIAVTGMRGLVVGTVISSLLILIVSMSNEKIHPVWSFLTELAAVATIWVISSLLQGALNGLAYAAAALALAAATHFGLTTVGYAVYRLRDPFVRYMLPNCQTPSN